MRKAFLLRRPADNLYGSDPDRRCGTEYAEGVAIADRSDSPTKPLVGPSERDALQQFLK